MDDVRERVSLWEWNRIKPGIGLREVYRMISLIVVIYDVICIYDVIYNYVMLHGEMNSLIGLVEWEN